MSTRRLRSFAILAMAMTLPALASAVVIDFEEYAHDYETQGAGDVLFTKGYVLQYAPAPDEPYPVGFNIIGVSYRFNGRSTAMLADNCLATTTLTAGDNNPFTLKSIDLAPVNGEREAFVVFEAVTSEGTLLSKTVRLPNNPAWHKFQFPATFTSLRHLRWTQGDCVVNAAHMFDNIDLFPTWKGASR